MNHSAVLLIDCPDRKGLVARVSGLLYERGANILHADQHQDHDLGLFFMRVEWALEDETDTSPAAPSHPLPAANPGAHRFDLEGFKATNPFSILRTLGFYFFDRARERTAEALEPSLRNTDDTN